MAFAQRLGRGAVTAAIAALTLLCLLATAASASAVKLNGGWAPFARCPVDSPAMLAADGVKQVASCASANSPSGSSKIGSTSLTTGESNLQFGLVLHNTTSMFSIVAPPGGALVAAPAKVPGGLVGLMCPSSVPVISSLCNEAENNNSLNAVTATVQSAGAPTDFSIAAELQVGKPIVTLPVKIHLQNPLLGSSCYIGTNSDPIVLHPANLQKPTFGNGEVFNANGTPNPNGVLQSTLLISKEGDSSFSTPGASGCGATALLSPVIDTAVDLKDGLPSASGNNSVVLNDVTSEIASFVDPSAFAPHEGQDLSKDWHSAVQP